MTPTNTQPLTEWEQDLADQLLVDVDLTKDVPCSWLIPCNIPATWLLVNLCCGLSSPHCDKHRTEGDKALAHLRENGGYDCRRCNAFNSDYEWVEL